MLASALLEDLRDLGEYTLVAPHDPAWDDLPLPFDDLVSQRAHVESRIDIFEHCVIPRVCTRVPVVYRSLARETIYVTCEFVYARRSSARILAREHVGRTLLLVTDRVLLPFSRRLCEKHDALALRDDDATRLLHGDGK